MGGVSSSEVEKIVEDEKEKKKIQDLADNKIVLENTIKGIVSRGYLLAFQQHLFTDKEGGATPKSFHIEKSGLSHEKIMNTLGKYILENDEEMNTETNGSQGLINYLLSKYAYNTYEKLYNVIKHRLHVQDCYVNLDSSLVLPIIHKINLYDCLPQNVKDNLSNNCKKMRKLFTVDLFLESIKATNELSNEMNLEIESFQNMNNNNDNINMLLFNCIDSDEYFRKLYDYFEERIKNELKLEKIIEIKTNQEFSDILFEISFIKEFSKNITDKIAQRLDNCQGKIEYFTNMKKKQKNILISTIVLSIVFYVLNNKNISKIVKNSLGKMSKNNLLAVNSVIFAVIYLILSKLIKI